MDWNICFTDCCLYRQAIHCNICMVLLDPGDEVLLPAPYWVSYSAIATLAEAKSIIIPSSIETDFKITPTTRGCHYTQNQTSDVQFLQQS